jgi:hypothetical protein
LAHENLTDLAGGDQSAYENAPATSSGETSQASAPEAKEGSNVTAIAERMKAKDCPTPGTAQGGSSGKETSQIWSPLSIDNRDNKSPLAKMAQRFLPGSMRSNDKPLLTVRQRSLSELHRAPPRSGRTRGRGRGKWSEGGRGGRPSKVPRLTPPCSTPEGSMHESRKRKRALHAEGNVVGRGASSPGDAADESIIKIEPAEAAEGGRQSEGGLRNSTLNLRRTGAQWRECASTLDRGGDSEAEAALSPPIRTPQQAAVGRLHWQWARTDSKTPLGLKMLVDEHGMSVPRKTPSRTLKIPIRATTRPLDGIPSAEDTSPSRLETPVVPTSRLQVRFHTLKT